MKRFFTLIVFFVFLQAVMGQPSIPTERTINFDAGWQFSKGDFLHADNPEYNDSKWRTLNLPHDWSIEDIDPPAKEGQLGPFTKSSAGGPFTGHTAGGTGWYRKHFVIPLAAAGKRIYIGFDGVYMHSDVWVNGHHAGNHPNGYTPFYYDITQYINKSALSNIIAVRVCNEGRNSRWYSGSGINRHVWLTAVSPTHIVPFGLHVSATEISAGHANVHVRTTIEFPPGMKESCSVRTEVISPNGELKRSAEIKLLQNQDSVSVLEQSIAVANPKLWSPDHPELYTIHVIVSVANKQTDEQTILFGIRSIKMDAVHGLTVNGERLILKGGCVHHDNGPLGAAAIDRADERRLQILKANGFNAIRTSHNPPTPYFLDLCDRLGFLVIDEAFDVWEQKKLFDDSTDYHHFFSEWWKKDLDAMVMRDRNHPAVFLWSIGNEIHERADPEGLATARKLIDEIHSLDTTRGITEGVCWFWDHPGRPWDSLQPVFALLDVGGYNYEWHRYDEEHGKFPDRVMAGTETYAMDIFDNFDYAEKHPFVLGDFVWTAWDYIGEAGIGHALAHPDSIREDKTMLQPWPWFNANCGDIDFIGNKKPQSYYRDVIWRNSKLEMLVQQPVPNGMKNIPNAWGWPDEIRSWTWPGQEGNELLVSVYSRCPVVRLELNGKLVAEKKMSAENKWKTIIVLPYAPGTLTVKGFEDGRQVASNILTTAGPADKIKLIADRKTIKADGKDLAYLMVDITDAKGQWVPGDERMVKFDVGGEGELAAVGNANPQGMQSFRQAFCKTFHGRCLLIIRSKTKAGQISIIARSEGLQPVTITLQTK